jgi:hypothetical protein
MANELGRCSRFLHFHVCLIIIWASHSPGFGDTGGCYTMVESVQGRSWWLQVRAHGLCEAGMFSETVKDILKQ